MPRPTNSGVSPCGARTRLPLCIASWITEIGRRRCCPRSPGLRVAAVGATGPAAARAALRNVHAHEPAIKIVRDAATIVGVCNEVLQGIPRRLFVHINVDTQHILRNQKVTFVELVRNVEAQIAELAPRWLPRHFPLIKSISRF